MLKNFDVFKTFNSTPEGFRNKFKSLCLVRRLKSNFLLDKMINFFLI